MSNIHNALADRSGSKSFSKWGYIMLPITNEAPQVSILYAILFSTFIDYFDAGLKFLLDKFSGETKLGGAIYFLEGREVVQNDFEKVEGWAITNHTVFNKTKFWILYLAQISFG